MWPMKKKRILFTSNIPVPYRMDFFNELGKLVDLTVVFERKNAKTRNDEWLNNTAKDFKPIFLKGINIGDDIAFCPEIINIIRKGNFDLIIIGIYYSPTGILLTSYLKAKKIPYAFSGDGGFFKKEPRFKFILKKLLINGASMYLVPSGHAIELLKHYGVPDNLCRIYPFSSIWEKDIMLPATIEEKKKKRKELNIKENFVVLAVGRLVFLKNWDLLIEASRYFDPSSGFYLIGGQPEGTCYEEIAYNSPDNFYFVDFKQKETLKDYFRSADVFVLPTRHDAWGLVINEAMAYGVPVITTDMCTAGKELIDDGINGLIIKVGDREGLVSALQTLKDNPDLIDNYSKKGYEKIKGYTIETMALSYFNYINELLECK